MAGIAVAVAVVFGLLLAVRVSQGAPSAATWAELGDDSRGPALALAGPGDQPSVSITDGIASGTAEGTVAGEVRTVQPGESYWSIALELSPGSDPRSIVDRLVEVNGGSSSLVVGQRILIPSDLVSGNS